MTNSTGLPGQGVSVSFEVFPPKTNNNDNIFWQVISQLERLEPSFLSVTYGAGGSRRERSLGIVRKVLQGTRLTPAAHITCVGSSRQEADAAVRAFYDAGVRHFVVLRGDLPAENQTQACHPQGYANASEFLSAIRADWPDVELTVAAYPEKHPESPDIEHDIEVLRQKVAAGATRCITQFFFETGTYLRFVEKARAAGIEIPIIPGILPVLNFPRVASMAEACGTHIPDWLQEYFTGIEIPSTLNSMLAAAVTIDQCGSLYDHGVRDFHFYTLNQAELTQAVCHSLGVRPLLKLSK